MARRGEMPMPREDERLIDHDEEARVVAALKVGMSVRDAARQIGVNPDTFIGWLRRGANATPLPPGPGHIDLLRKVEKARSDFRLYAAKCLYDAMAADWRIAAKVIEMSAPEEYGRGESESLYKPDADGTESTEVLLSRLRSRLQERGVMLPGHTEPVPYEEAARIIDITPAALAAAPKPAPKIRIDVDEEVVDAELVDGDDDIS